MRDMSAAVDHQRLVAEVLGIRGAPPALARRLVAQALVVEDRRDAWRRTGERICADAPATPGVYVIRDERDRALYVGKAVNLRRRLRAHFANRRWRATKSDLARASSAEWTEVGSELEALLREAALIAALQPIVNVQTGAPALETRAIPAALIRDVLVVVPSIESDSVELIAARADGAWTMQRTRRNGADLAVHAQRLMKFFVSAVRARPDRRAPRDALAPIVFSWLAGRGADATRLDPRAAGTVRVLRARLAALLRDERLFQERLEQC
jgi:predicted GIY-YIG superfamily endonuclease